MLTIREANIRDLPGIAALERLCFASDAFTARQLKYLLTRAKASSWVALSDDNLTGYCTALLPALPKPARLYSLAVHPAFRAQHIASQLVLKTKAVAFNNGHDRLRLEVNENNVPAIGLYTKLGFHCIGIIKAYYQDQSNAIKMQCFTGARRKQP